VPTSPLRTRCLLLLLLTAASASLSTQSSTRRLTTIDALRQFPAYFHQQNVMIRGQFVERSGELVLTANMQDIRLMNPSEAHGGNVEVRGQMFDVGKLERGDPRLGTYSERFKAEEWPRPGMEVALRITSVTEAAPAVTPSVRALSLEPAKFDGQTVTVVGSFRGRNLYGDLPEAPGKSRYDFVLTGAEGAVWISNMRPRGRGFDLDVERRLDTGRWLEVTGVVGLHRGLAVISATRMALGEAPAVTEAPEEPSAPPAPSPPVEVVFSSPTTDETDVSPTSTIRVQFSRGLREPSSLANQIRVSYVGGNGAPPAFKTTYDAATRSIQITFATPLEPYRTVKVELLDTIRAFDGGPLKPWTLTYSVGSK
jgi:hypothetical protein